MRSWSAKWIIITSVLQCIACGADLPALNPFTIAGQVNLRGLPDGGSEVQVSAVVHRPLADGGSVAVLDAGVALNGVPLGPGDPAGEMTGHLFQLIPPPPGSQPPEILTWTRPSFPGAGYELRQTLSVIGSFPEATATFTCPVAVSFTTPPEGTSLSRGQPIRIGWTSGGSSSFSQIFVFQSDLPILGPGPVLFGFGFFQPGVTSTEFTFPPDFPRGNVRLTFSLFVFGDSPSFESGCAAVPMRSLLFP
jgi:hypothetical protein